MAALFENIGLEPSIVLVPGHAFVGVRETPGSEIFYCIETTLLGKSLNDNTFLNDLFSKQSVFEKALQSAWNTLDHYRQLDEATAIDIKIAREEGFLPMQ